jgi:hypothetical protein
MIELIAILISIFTQSNSADGCTGAGCGDGHSDDTGNGSTGNG